MSDVIIRNTPTQYQPLRLAIQPDDGEIRASADFAIRNADDAQIDVDHPSVTLPDGQTVTLEEDQTMTLNPDEPLIVLLDGPFTIRADGALTAKTGIKPSLLHWFNEQCEVYEGATGLERYVPPQDETETEP